MKYILFSLLIIISIRVFGQVEFEYKTPLTREVIINFDDSLVNANILLKTKKIKIDNTLLYYWYLSNRLGVNRGGFEGNLLHGNYSVFDKKRNLIRKGSYSNGLKNGEWKRWFENGNILEISEWKDGQLDGVTQVFDKDGKLINVRNYKKNKLHGENTFYYSNQTIVKKYKDGVEIVPKVKKQKEIRIENTQAVDEKDKKKSSFFRFFHKSTKPVSEVENKQNAEVAKPEVKKENKTWNWIKNLFKKKQLNNAPDK